MTVQPVVEIYGNGELTEKDISIDHFVPWSYVANDEIWNLHPTTKSINSSKSNHLPRWDVYFKKLSGLEYLSYQLMWRHDGIRKEFEKIKKKHLNSPLVEDGCMHRTFRVKSFAADCLKLCFRYISLQRQLDFGSGNIRQIRS